jgi:hypothetical protein
MTLALMLLAATALAQTEGPPPPPPPPAAPIVAGVPDDQVPAEADAPPEFPRVVRRGDQICQQSVTQDGQIASECRAAQLAHASQPPSSVRFIGSIGALGGGAVLFAAGGSLALGAFGAFGEAGVQFTDLLGLVLVVNLWVALTDGVDVEVISFAPGLRLGGRRVSVTFSLGPSVLAGRISTVNGAASGADVAGTFLTTGVFRVAGPFSLFAQAGASFQSSGVMLHFGGGLGASL